VSRTVDQLVNQIGRLAPGQRRVLFRQLKAMGLLETDVLLSDRDPLRIALAVPSKNLERDKTQTVTESERPRPPRPADRPQVIDHPSADGGSATAVRAMQQENAPPETSSAQGGVPQSPIRIVFDGGSRGNPGKGYGSFALDWPGYPRELVQLTFGDQATNNEAEYDTLIAALEAVGDRLIELQIDPGSANLSIWGDSLLVCNQVRGEWACKEPRLQARLKTVRDLLTGFGESELHHHPREKSVEILGH